MKHLILTPIDPLGEDFAEAARDTSAIIRACESRETAAMLISELALIDARPAYRAALRTAFASA